MDDTHYKAQVPTTGGATGELALAVDNGKLVLEVTNERGEASRFQLDKQAALDFHEGLERSMFFLQYIK